MHFSFSSMLLCFMWGNISIAFILILLRYEKSISRFGVQILLIFMGLTLIRFALPIEFGFTKTIKCKVVLPAIESFLERPLFLLKITNRQAIFAIWCMVAFCKLVRFIWFYIKIFHLIKKRQLCRENEAVRILNIVCARHNVKTTFKVVKLENIESPFIMGLCNPIIILPLSEFKSRDLEFVLEHEIAHFYNHDLWKKFMIEILCIVYWWNPFLYLLKASFDNILELRADAAVIENLSEKEKVEYLECLIKIAKKKLTRKEIVFALPFYNRVKQNNLERRFHFILNSKKKEENIKKKTFMIAAIGVFIMSFSFIFEAYQVAPDVEQATFAISPENAYIVKKNNQYCVYVDGYGIMQINEIKDSLKNLPVYEKEKR